MGGAPRRAAAGPLAQTREFPRPGVPAASRVPLGRSLAAHGGPSRGPMLESLDRSQFAVICYYDGGHKDITTERIRRTASSLAGRVRHARAAAGRADPQRRGRHPLRPGRPHGRQPPSGLRPKAGAASRFPGWATWARPGCEAMDYVLGDRYQIPEGDERYYSERGAAPARRLRLLSARPTMRRRSGRCRPRAEGRSPSAASTTRPRSTGT